MESFLIKKHAEAYLQKCNNDTLRLFQEDITNDNKKRFIIASYDDIYKLIEKGRNNLYESWTNKSPLYFGIDIDIKKDLTLSEEKNLLKNIITAVIDISKNIYNYTYKIKDFYISKTENQKEKLSIHINCKGIVFENYLGCKNFYEQLKKTYNLEGIDDSIYRLTCLRMTYCTKKNKNCVLKPYYLKLGREITGKCKTKKEFWLNSLITNTPVNCKIIKNKKYKKELKEEFIVNEKSNNVQLEALLYKLPSEYYDNFEKWIKVGLVCYNDNKKNYDIFDKWSKQSNKYNKNNNKKYWNSFKENSNKITVGSLIYWLKENNIDINNILPSIKYVVDNYPENKIIISSDYNIKEINKNKLDSNDIKYGYNDKLFCIQSEKGTGKTTSLIKYLFENNNNIPESILFVSSRRTFGIKLLNDLEKYGFKLYSNIEEQYISLKRVIIQINSLTRLRDLNYDLIIIDECESLARYLTSSHFMKNSSSSIIISDFEYRVRCASKTIIMDADLSDRCINYYKNVLELDNNEIKILKNKKTPYSEYTIKYSDYELWVSIILDKIGENKKLVIPMASNNKAKDLKNYINTKYPNKSILLIHKETNDKEKLERLINVNNDWIKFDVVIYTPTVCMGVSFDIPNYFDYIFAYGCHESLGSQEFCQMIHRVREPKYKEIYIAIDKYKIYDITEDEINYQITEEMICSQYYLTKFDIHNNLIPKKYGKDRVLVYPYKNESLYDLYIRNSMERIADINNFTACFFGYCKYKKYKLEFINDSINNECKQDLKELANQRKEHELNTFIENILKADNLSLKEYKEKIMRKDEYMDDETLYAIKKRNIFDCYDLTNFDDINDTFIRSYSDKNIMINYTNLKTILNHSNQSTDEKIKILKQNEKYNIDYLNIYEEFKNRNKFTFHYYPYILLKFLGCDINTIDNNMIDEESIINKINTKIESYNIKDFLEKEKYAIQYQYNLRKVNIDYTDIDKIIGFINKIIKKQYGIILKKNKKKYMLTTNKVWDNINRENKIITKKIKSNIKYDNDNVNITEELDKIII